MARAAHTLVHFFALNRTTRNEQIEALTTKRTCRSESFIPYLYFKTVRVNPVLRYFAHIVLP